MIHYEGSGVTLHHGDCLDVLRTLPDADAEDPYEFDMEATSGTEVAEDHCPACKAGFGCIDTTTGGGRFA